MNIRKSAKTVGTDVGAGFGGRFGTIPERSQWRFCVRPRFRETEILSGRRNAAESRNYIGL